MINLGEIEINETIKKQLKIIENITLISKQNKIKVWFNGTYGVVGYYGKFFSVPDDVDCGVLKGDYDKFKNLLIDNEYEIFSEKDNGKFKVVSFTKDKMIVELGTFEESLGDNYANIENVNYSIPNSKWLASCYRVTSTKTRRQGKNDLDRALFLESIN